MKLSNLYWMVFKESGSIDAYLAYKKSNCIEIWNNFNNKEDKN